MLQSPCSSSSSKEKKKKVTSEEKTKISASKPAKSSTDKSGKSATDSRSAKPSTEDRIVALDQKWSDRFNQLKALWMARTLERELTFQAVVMPMHTPPVGSVKSTDPFINSIDQGEVLKQRCQQLWMSFSFYGL